ncbi:MAG: DUF3108 domain-containing protein [Endomicrobia bacterium]|nr:DUF3108 domain-containing protein [Endomicrobiia bacterium]
MKLFIVNCLLLSILYAENSLDLEKKILLNNIGLRKIKPAYSEEVLCYRIYWEFVPAGDAEMGIKKIELFGQKVYHIYTKTKSNKSIDLIYKVRNETHSYVDCFGFYTLKFVKNQNEAGYVSKDNVVFDHVNGQWYYLLDNTTGYIPVFVQDVVSSLYWLRMQEIDVGKKYTFDVWVGKVVYPMVVDVLGITKVKIENRIYECFKVEPKVDIQSFPLFKAKGRLFVYITTDKQKLPVRLESKVFIGRVFADLVEIK